MSALDDIHVGRRDGDGPAHRPGDLGGGDRRLRRDAGLRDGPDDFLWYVFSQPVKRTEIVAHVGA